MERFDGSNTNNISSLNDDLIKVADRTFPRHSGTVAADRSECSDANAQVARQPRGDSDALPPASRLVLASGRTREAVERLLERAAEPRNDSQPHASMEVSGHAYRGYAVLEPVRGARPSVEVLEGEGEQRPVWFVLSGMGTHCPGVARSLLRLPAFAASVARAAATLEPFGLDLRHVLADAPAAAFDDVVYCCVSIAAVQVALVDVLQDLGLRPDGIIGASFGEIGAGYADGALSAEQAVLLAYWRGRSLAEAGLARGAMAVIGLPWEQVSPRCVPDIDCGIHIFTDRILVSGPREPVERLVGELSAEGASARLVDDLQLAFHSRHVAPAAPLLRARLQRLIPEPRPRSARWLSTSIPPERWADDLARLGDAAYYVNNLVSPVWLGPVLARVPARALLLELAPRARLQNVLRRALPHARVVPLLCDDAPDALAHLLGAVGKIYAAGAQPQVTRLYGAASRTAAPPAPSAASMSPHATSTNHATDSPLSPLDIPRWSGARPEM